MHKSGAERVEKLTQKWRGMAKVVEDDDLLDSVSEGDDTANKVYYHKSNIKPCVQKFRYEYEIYIWLISPLRKKQVLPSGLNSGAN